jgi:hypothetical protein
MPSYEEFIKQGDVKYMMRVLTQLLSQAMTYLLQGEINYHTLKSDVKILSDKMSLLETSSTSTSSMLLTRHDVGYLPATPSYEKKSITTPFTQQDNGIATFQSALHSGTKTKEVVNLADGEENDVNNSHELDEDSALFLSSDSSSSGPLDFSILSTEPVTTTTTQERSTGGTTEIQSPGTTEINTREIAPLPSTIASMKTLESIGSSSSDWLLASIQHSTSVSSSVPLRTAAYPPSPTYRLPEPIVSLQGVNIDLASSTTSLVKKSITTKGDNISMSPRNELIKLQANLFPSPVNESPPLIGGYTRQLHLSSSSPVSVLDLYSPDGGSTLYQSSGLLREGVASANILKPRSQQVNLSPEQPPLHPFH